MTSEDRILFLCARQDFLPGHRDAVQALCRGRDIRWELLAKTAARHGVLPIVGANLRQCDAAVLRLPPGFAERLEIAVFESAAVRERDADRLATALARLREVELHAMLLKGTALTLLVYREPWVVTSHDIDLVLRPGPTWEKGKGEEKAVRKSLYTNGIECDLKEHHDVTMNGVLPIDFPRIWRDARPARFRGEDIWLPSPEDLLLSLCINACRKRYFRLKGLFDLAETVARLRGPDWGRVAALAREGRCEGMAHAALVATRETVGCDLPAGALDGLGVSPVKARLLERLIAAFVRRGSVVDRTGERLAMLLTYASFRPAEAWRSFRHSLTHPPKHRAPAELTPRAT
ncbi:MAG TPA: nucleotidyltransferase family protein [Thermoanaerobaculia bacterium]|nr:nucleotidyltransferase family protein [Thermoanaerobaculia bacterium]